ncbi:hypothetical protein CKA32_000154 [Geitlerinema sp. FC II]|nr:hypothetical protein CKA32_000154 [Geitlerinema sp. FC II]
MIFTKNSGVSQKCLLRSNFNTLENHEVSIAQQKHRSNENS